MLLLLSIVGVIALALFALCVFQFVRSQTSSFSFSRYKGDWAVVTGASAGIGEAFVLGLAKRGLNVALLARSKDKLDTIAKTCESKYGVKTLVHPFDFAAASDPDWASLADVLSALKVTVLVNNVGVNVEHPTEFVDMSRADVSRIVDVNIGATNVMTALLLPGMIDVGRGVIFCLSSGGGAITPAPLLAPYAGTKAYNDSFAVALSGEVAEKGVHVHSLTPFFVESSMAKMRRSFTVPSATEFAESALRQIGSGSPRLNPYWVHQVMAGAITLLPLESQVKYVADLHRKIRKRALRKKERIAAAAAKAN